MKNKKTLAAISITLIAIMTLSTAFTIMQGSSSFPNEPLSLSQLTEYPGFSQMHDLTQMEIDTEIVALELTGAVRGIPVEGAFEIRTKLQQKGYIQSFFDVFFDVFTDVQVSSPDGLEIMTGTVFKGWSRTMMPDGTKVMIAGGVLQSPLKTFSIMIATPTNVLPPEQMPGIDPYIIWNAEPYFYMQFYWYAWAPYGRLVYWDYYWFDSHKTPNWFWGTYWWWRTYIKNYYGVYDWPYWWWWHWYYWRGWYWWSTQWPYP